MKAGRKQQSNRLVEVALSGVLALGLGACSGEKAVTETQVGDAANTQMGGTSNADGGLTEKPAVAQDSALSSRVKLTLERQPGLKALSVDVDAASGAVTLYGTANTATHRELAGQLALGVEGVKSVTNHLIIVRET